MVFSRPVPVTQIHSQISWVIIPIVLLGLITVWPFLDRKPDASRRPQRVRFAVIAAGMLILIALTIWGEVS